MPFNWDDAGQKQLLLAVIHLTVQAPPKWDQVAQMLGQGCTGEGARKQFAKLKNMANESFGESGVVAEEEKSTPKTPAKGQPKKAAAKRKTKATDEAADAGDEESSNDKRVKTEEHERVSSED